MSQPPSDGKPPTLRAKSMREVADRTVRIATNLLVTGLILIVGVVLGRQMLARWHDASQPSVMNAPSKVATGLEPTSPILQFGNLRGALIRSETEGSLDNALTMLRRDCRTAAEKATVGPVVRSEPFREWLSRLADRQPAEQLAGQWSLYELRIPLPMVAVVTDPAPSSAEAASRDPRVLSWGIAFEARDDPSTGEPSRWTTFAFIPHAQTAGASDRGVPMPDGCRRLMTIDDGSELLIGFTSPLAGASLASDWERVLRSEEWEMMDGWRHEGAAWHGHFRLRKDLVVTLDVQFSAETPDGTQILGFCRRASDSR